MKSIDEGYCIFIKDFYATVVMFKTLSVTYAIDTVPLYEIELQNGEIDERNETELVYTKDELKKQAIKLNKKMEKDRKFWNEKGLPVLRRAGLA